MAGKNLSPEVTIWTDALHAPSAGQLMRLMGSALKPIGVGGPPVSEVSRLGKELGCEVYDDLRKMSIDRPASYLLLATLERVLPEHLHALAEQDTLVLSLEPVASDLQGLSASDALGAKGAEGVGAGVRIIQVPSFSQCPGYLSAADPGDLLGDRRLVSMVSLGQADQGSLFARLFDAWQTVLGYTLLPEMVDASLIGPLEEAPATLVELTGALAVHARLAGTQSVLLHVSDIAPDARRELTVQGDGATLRINDAGYTLHKPTGEVLDEADGSGTPGQFIDLLAHQWRRLLDSPTLPRPSTKRQTDAMACCLACLLSIRTGQPESPGKVLQMGG